MNEYTCKNGHKFTSKASIRAFCPECGESTKRSRVQNGEINTGGTETDAAAKQKEPEKEQSKEPEKEGEQPEQKKEPARTKVIRVKKKEPDKEEVAAKKKTKEVEEKDDRSKLIKRRRIKERYRHPQVKGRVKTNKETQAEKEGKQARATTWEQIRKRAGFGS